MSGKETYEYIYKYVYPTLSALSTALACIVVITMIALTIYDRKLVDRVTLRLQTGISFCDIALHTLPLWARPFKHSPNTTCSFIAWLFFFVPLVYCFLNVGVGVNLQLIFLHGIDITRKIEISYWVSSILLALIITIPPLALGKIGWSPNRCLIASTDEEFGRKFDLYLTRLTTILVILYLIVVVSLVLIELNKGIGKVKTSRRLHVAGTSREAAKSIRKLGNRIVLYPIIMMFSQTGITIQNVVYDLTGVINYDLRSWGNITVGLTGTLNFIAFCCDPTIHAAFKKIYQRFIVYRATFKSKPIINGEFGPLGSENDLNGEQRSSEGSSHNPEIEMNNLNVIMRSM